MLVLTNKINLSTKRHLLSTKRKLVQKVTIPFIYWSIFTPNLLIVK